MNVNTDDPTSLRAQVATLQARVVELENMVRITEDRAAKLGVDLGESDRGRVRLLEENARLTQQLAACEKDRDEAKAQFEQYAGWSLWRPGLWLISFPPSGARAEFVAEQSDFDAAMSPDSRTEEKQ